ncbi:MAG: 3D domain-containing protein [Eubacteriales bacterium]|nr:3D domain-containing protein [Eubacteriales bacterium]
MQEEARTNKRLSVKAKQLILLPIFLLTLLALAILIKSAFFEEVEKTVIVCDKDETFVIKTFKNTLGEAFVQNDISIGREDSVSLPEDTVLSSENVNKVFIKRAVPVSIVTGDEIDILYTSRDTVGEVLGDNDLELGSNDRIEGVTLDTPVEKNMVIKLVRVTEKYVAENIPLPFRVEERMNNNMDEGTTLTVREGIEGLSKRTFKLILENNKIINKSLLAETVIREPIHKLVEIGTILNFINSRGDTVRYKQVMDMRATSYTASFEDCGKHPDHPEFGITYTGMKVRPGIIATDRRVIPMGTKVYVEVLGNTPDYGYAIAADIGSAVKGNLIDLYFEDADYVKKWGVKKVRIYVLKNQDVDVFALRNDP